jgi:hypothetical protein
MFIHTALKLQNINAMKILPAVMQRLYKDVRTDKQTDMANLTYALLKLVIKKMLRIIVALAKHPVGPEVTTISQLTLPLQQQITGVVKKQNLVTVHILTVHPVLTSQLQFRHNTNTENFQHDRPFCCSKYSYVIQESIIIILLLSYTFIFGHILLSLLVFHGRDEVLQV